MATESGSLNACSKISREEDVMADRLERIEFGKKGS